MTEWEINKVLDKLDIAMKNELKARTECTEPKLSIQDSEILRLSHHDINTELGQYNPAEVAEILEIELTEVSESIARGKKDFPKLYVILTVLEADCCECYVNDCMTQAEIAAFLNISKNAVTKCIHRARDKGLYIPSKRFRNPDGPKMLRYCSDWMDKFVISRF